MAAKFQIDITAKDRTAAAIKSVNDNFAKISKGSSLGKVHGGLGDIIARAKGFGGVTRGILSMGDAGALASGGIGEAAGGLAGMAAAAAAVATGVGAVVVGVAAATAALWKFEAAQSGAGATTARTAAVLGISTYQLQQYELAGKRMGVSAKAMDGALQGVGSTMEDAASGRNQAALMLMNRLGVTIHRLPNGAIDAARGMNDLASAMARQNPQARAMIAQQFGLAGAMNFVIASARERKAALDAAAASGAIKTKAQLEQDEKIQASMAATKEKWDALVNVFERKFAIPGMEFLISALEKVLDLTRAVISVPRKIYNFGASIPGFFGLHVPTGQGGPRAGSAPAVSGPWSSPARGAGQSGNGSLADRNNNPGNLTDGRGHFLHFADRRAGFAAMGRQLLIDYDRHGQRTISEIINDPRHGWSNQWSPGNSVASTRNYIGRVSRSMGIAADADLNLDDPAILARLELAMNAVERGGVPSGGANGHVHVDVHLRGAPAGTSASVEARGNGVTAGARITPSMAGAAV